MGVAEFPGRAVESGVADPGRLGGGGGGGGSGGGGGGSGAAATVGGDASALDALGLVANLAALEAATVAVHTNFAHALVERPRY